MPNTDAIAIIGMGAVFPKAIGLKQYWRLLFNGKDAITDIPEKSHWALKDYFDENPSAPDRTYCTRGGFLPKINFDPARYSFPPNNLDATDTSQLLGLTVAEMALEDAGYPVKSPQFTQELKRRTNILLGVTGTQELVIPLGARLYHPHWKKALEEADIPEEKRCEILQRISNKFPQWQENSFPGLLGNVVAGRIANRLDLGGTNSVVDAACASSLSAVHTACLELQTGRCDMSLTGGVDTLNDIFMHMCFSKTGVLSHTSDAKPFSKDADGTVLGEGIGMVVLKRLEDAKRNNDRIYAVIRGIGTSSDGKTGGIYAPDSDGQFRALTSAYERARIDPSTVELFEAHGTGTRVGDKIEFSALNKLVSESNSKTGSDKSKTAPEKSKTAPDNPETASEKTDEKTLSNTTTQPLKLTKKNRAALGSVKSMIGHAKAAAGVAGLIKSVLSIYNQVIPPTLKADKPDPELGIENSALYLNDRSKPWTASGEHPRRSGVSAFGFGGSNFHAVLEEYSNLKDHVAWDGTIQIAAFSNETLDGLKTAVHQFQNELTPPTQPIPTTWDSLESDRILAWQTAKSRHAFNSSDPYRLLMMISDVENPLDKCLSAISFLTDLQADKNDPAKGKKGKESDIAFDITKHLNNMEKEGIFFGSGKHIGKTAFLFPGQGSQYTGMGRELISIFPEASKTLEAAHNTLSSGPAPLLAETTLPEAIFPPPAYLEDPKSCEERLRQTRIAQPAIGSVSLAMAKILKRFGIEADAACGHSFGELTALCAAGWMDDKTFFSLAGNRGKYMAEAAAARGDAGSMMALKAPLKTIETLIEEEKLDLILANRNSHEQGVLSGTTEEIKRAGNACKKRKMRGVKLPVAAAFHSKLVERAAEPFASKVESAVLTPNDTTVISNTTGKAYPANAKKAAKILGEQLSRPVDFVGDIETLLKDGVQTFIEVGPKRVLTGLTQSMVDHGQMKGAKDGENKSARPLGMKNQAHGIQCLAMDASNGKKPGIEDLAILLCALGASGVPVDFTQWETPAEKPAKKIMSVPVTGANPKPKEKVIPKPDAPKIVSKDPKPFSQNTNTEKTNISNHSGNREPSSSVGSTQTPPASPKPMQAPSIPTAHTPFRGTDMNSKSNAPDPNLVFNAMQLVQKGMESMQELQARTAQAHEKFLETQTSAGMTLQAMMEQTRFFAQNAIQSGSGFVGGSPLQSNPHATIPDRNNGVGRNRGNDQGGYPSRNNGSAPNHSVLSDPSTLNHPGLTQTGFSPANPASPESPAADSGNMFNPYRGQQQKQAPQAVPSATGNPASAYQIPAEMPNTQVSQMEKAAEAAMAPVNALDNAAMAPSPVAQPAPATSPPPSASNQNPEAVLLETVSNLTGFPVGMLSLDMDIESDLGIDSIKRVEIVSELEKSLPGVDALTPENMGTLRTLKDIVEAIAPGLGSASADDAIAPPPAAASPAPLSASSSSLQQTAGNAETGLNANASSDVMGVLMATISALTGFPTEMLTPDMDLESDLGIDSIKRVEILSSLEQKLPQASTITPDDLGTLKTLAQIAERISGKPESKAVSPGTPMETDAVDAQADGESKKKS